MPLNSRLDNLSFSRTLCRTAYTGKQLDDRLIIPSSTEQLRTDKDNLESLSHDYDQHQTQFFGERGHYPTLRNMEANFAGNLLWTAGEFFSWHATPKVAMFGAAEVPVHPAALQGDQQPENEFGVGSGADSDVDAGSDVDSDPESESDEVVSDRINPGQSSHATESLYDLGDLEEELENGCDMPITCEGLSMSHRKLAALSSYAWAAITPAKGSTESFVEAMRDKNWDGRLKGVSQQYWGDPAQPAGPNQPLGEYAQIDHDFRAAWQAIEFGEGLAHWLPSLSEVAAPPLPGLSAYVTGFSSFITVCAKIWQSRFLKPTMPIWKSDFFESARASLSSYFGKIPSFLDVSRPQLEKWIDPPAAPTSDLYGTWLPALRNFCRSVGRGVLGVVSLPAWALKIVVINITANALILAANALYNGGVGVLWFLTGVAQAVKFSASGLWQFLKCIAYPTSKILGWTLITAAYLVAALLYPEVATAAWVAKLVLQTLRLVGQNFIVEIYNRILRPLAWLAKYAAVLARAGISYVGTGIKHALHWSYTKVAHFVNHVALFSYYYMVRPALEGLGKAALLWAQIGGHLSLATLQLLVFVPAKVAFNYFLKPAWYGFQVCASKLVEWARLAVNKLASACKWLWNNILLPVGWHAGQFFVAKPLLALAFILQLPVYVLITILGEFGVGLGFVATEAGLWLKSQWISKAFYPLPLSAWYRDCEGYENVISTAGSEARA